MARVLYVIGVLDVIGAGLWLFEVFRKINLSNIASQYEAIAWAAGIPSVALLCGLLIIAFGIVLDRLKAIQYTGERSADALAELAGRSRSS